MKQLTWASVALVALLALATACTTAASSPATLTIYSGRNEQLVGPLLERYAKETGTNVRIRYGDTAELAATILEEGSNSPADIFFAQDAGALGALSARGVLKKLPDADLNKVATQFRSAKGDWVGLSGRARVVAYNTSRLTVEQLPSSILEFTDPKWKGKLGWAPTNASFQAFVTALRQTEGEAGARAWLEGIKRNEPKSYPNNIAVVDAVGRGEIDAGFVNHYYLFTFLREQGDQFPVRNYHPRAGGAGAMINVAGIGILNTSKHSAEAERFVQFLLSNEAQQYFAGETFEYPLVTGVAPPAGVDPIDSFKTPNVDLNNISDLEGTLRLLRETGAL